MNNSEFKEKVFKELEKWSYLGASENEVGVKLLGHIPHVAPRAYLHTLFTPLNAEEISDLEKKLGFVLPQQVREFYKLSNGLELFLGAIRIRGLDTRYRREDMKEVSRQPSSIIVPNINARVKGMATDDLALGWYKDDQSIAIVSRGGKVERYDVASSGNQIAAWSNFDAWVVSEIKRLAKGYDKLGRKITELQNN